MSTTLTSARKQSAARDGRSAKPVIMATQGYMLSVSSVATIQPAVPRVFRKILTSRFNMIQWRYLIPSSQRSTFLFFGPDCLSTSDSASLRTSSSSMPSKSIQECWYMGLRYEGILLILTIQISPAWLLQKGIAKRNHSHNRSTLPMPG